MKDTFIKTTSIPGVLIIERPTFKDERGFFHEIFRLNELDEALGFKFSPVQWSHSLSYPNVIRAIHSERWNKLVYPLTGKVFAAIVDFREKLPSFLRKETFIFDNESKETSHKALFLPKGVGNSICAIGKIPVHYMYLVDDYWEGSKAQGVLWSDPDLNIKWPIKNPIISERDKNNPTLKELFPHKFKNK